MADTYIKISELEETTLADDTSFIPIDNGNHTYKISVENYNSGANATAKSYAEAAAASADDAETAKTAAEAAETETGLIRTATQQYATAAAGSAADSAASAIEASTYAEGAATSESNAEAAAQDAADYATLASDKATLAESWAVGDTHTRTGEDTNNASYYAGQAQGAYENALEQADAAGDSADAAASSASDAADSATAAAGSASDASDYATAASGSATAAATSATQSANSAGAAATSATNAAASATAASGSASTATTQATNAAQSATTAGGYATQAASSASDASGYATNAANSATAAAGSATTASNQATAAAGSATAAASSASDAADSAADAAESAATFTTDDTLSIAGKAADAKAAGDMIAAVQAEIPELDNWLTTPGAAAEAKHTGDRITEVEDDAADLKRALGYNVTFTPEIERASINATTGKNTSDAYTTYYRTGGFYRPKHIKAISSRGNLNTWIYFYASDDVNTYISRSIAYSNLDADVEYPDGANYVRITGQVSNDPDNPIDLTAITVVMTPILEDVNTRLDTLEANQTDIGALSQKVTANTENIKNVRTLDVLRNYPICDHLFVNKTGSDIVIPSESVYHARISRRLGYRVMELNTRVTSDGVLFVHHLANGKFGQYFHHVDGETDISNIMANTVTWQWILDNVRYNSQIERFRTAPSTLETMLRECKQQNIVPLVELVGNALQVADEIMGKDNYIAHGATRKQAPTATIIRWNQTLTTKQDIVDYCDAIGTPLIYAIGNPTSFTDEQLADITATLHDKGYMMGTSYNDYWWYKYRRFGFDFDSAQMLMNRIDCGNLCNYQSIFGFDNFVYTNANVANGELTYTAGGTLSPNIDSTVYQLSGFALEIVYNGRITFPQVGEFNGVTINGDGATPIYLSVPIINGSPKITLTVAKDTVIKDIKFTASVF